MNLQAFARVLSPAASRFLKMKITSTAKTAILKPRFIARTSSKTPGGVLFGVCETIADVEVERITGATPAEWCLWAIASPYETRNLLLLKIKSASASQNLAASHDGSNGPKIVMSEVRAASVVRLTRNHDRRKTRQCARPACFVSTWLVIRGEFAERFAPALSFSCAGRRWEPFNLSPGFGPCLAARTSSGAIFLQSVRCAFIRRRVLRGTWPVGAESSRVRI